MYKSSTSELKKHLRSVFIFHSGKVLYKSKRWIVKQGNKSIVIYDISNKEDPVEYALSDVEENPKKFGKGITSRLDAFKFYEKIGRGNSI